MRTSAEAMMIKNTEGFIGGWLDTGIGELVRFDTQVLLQFHSVMVTCVDSITDLGSAEIAHRILSSFPACKRLGSGIIVPGILISEVEHTIGLFSGFDEIWCYDTEPTAAKPEGVSILPPPNFDLTELPTDLVRWMADSMCRLALGDGLGLNYASSDVAIVQALRQAGGAPG